MIANRQIRQIIFPLLAALIWGTAFVAQSMCTDYVEPFTFNTLRSVIACFVLYGLIKIQQNGSIYRLKVKNINKRRKNFLKNRDLIIGGVLCGIALTLAANLQQFGISDTQAGKAGFITALYIVLVPIFQLFLRKTVPKKVWIGVTFAVFGLYFLCVKNGLSIEKSDIILFLCAIVFSIHILIIDHYSDKVNGIELSFVQFFVVAVISGICTLIFEKPQLLNIIKCILPVLYVGIFSSGVAYTLQILAQRDSNPTVVSLLLSLEAVFATIAGFFILGEVLSIREIFGCILMFTAVILAEI